MADQGSLQSSLQFSGERIVPQAVNCEPKFALKMYQEHIARYNFAAQLVKGKSVLDVGCGVGYGAQRLGQVGAASVLAFDLSAEAINHAKVHYAHRNVRFIVENAEDFSFGEKFDVVTCFELIEHVEKPEQVMRRIQRALKPDGLLIMSTPRALDQKRTHFHTKEFTFGEFEDMILRYLPQVKMYFENNHFTSLIVDAAPKALNNIELLQDQFSLRQADVFMAVAAMSAETVIPALDPVLVVNDDAYVLLLERDVAILHKAEDDLKDRLAYVEQSSQELASVASSQAQEIALLKSLLEEKNLEVERLVASNGEMGARVEVAKEALRGAERERASLEDRIGELDNTLQVRDADIKRLMTLYGEVFGDADVVRRALSGGQSLSDEQISALRDEVLRRQAQERHISDEQISALRDELQVLRRQAQERHIELQGALDLANEDARSLRIARDALDGELTEKQQQNDRLTALYDELFCKAIAVSGLLEAQQGLETFQQLRIAELQTSLDVARNDAQRHASHDLVRALTDDLRAARKSMDALRNDLISALDGDGADWEGPPVTEEAYGAPQNERDAVAYAVARVARERDFLRADRDRLIGEWRDWSRRYTEASSALERLAQERHEERAQRESADQLAKEQSARADASENARMDAERRQAEYRQRAESAEQAKNLAEHALDEVRRSASWRVSAPLRVASNLLGRPTKRWRNAVKHYRVHGLRSTLDVVARRLIGPRQVNASSQATSAAVVRTDSREISKGDAASGPFLGTAEKGALAPALTNASAVYDVIFLIGCWEGESKRYRVYNVERALKREGLHVVTMDFSDYGQVISRKMTARTLLIFRSPFFEHGRAQELFDYARRVGMRTVFDIDDLVFEPELVSQIEGVKLLTPEQREEYMVGVHAYRRMLLASDMVTVTTEPLKCAVERLGASAAIVPNCLNEDQLNLAAELVARKERNWRTRVGYFPGSKTHQLDFAEVEPALLRLMRARDDFELLIVGFLDLGPQWDPYLHRVGREGFMPYLDMLKCLSSCDINIAPLEVGDPFCEAKSELKYFEAALVETVTIASPTAPFKAAIQDGVTGMLAHGPAEWEAKLSQLLSDAKLRQKIGEAARIAAVDMFGPKRNAASAQEAYFGSIPIAGAVDTRPSSSSTHNLLLTPQTSQVSVIKEHRKVKIDWIIPRLIIGGGGHRNILRAAYFLEQFGHDVCLHFQGSDDQAEKLQVLVRQNFYDIQGVARAYDGQFRETDVIMATHWTTVDGAMRARDRAKDLMYFVQDFEPAFAPMGTEYIMAENTYRMGLYCITSGPWCERVLRDQYQVEADHFRFPIDTAVYRPRPRTKQSPNIVFFAKPEMPRRCFELGVWALARLHQLRPHLEILLFGSKKAREIGVSFPAKFLEIVPTIDDLAEMYANADLGLVFSTTNPSLVPYEMMASGCPVVDLRRPGNEYNYGGRTDIAFLADPIPERMADEIAQLLDDTEERARRRDAGLAFAAGFPDEKGMARRVEELILARLARVS
jgi:ubiquinone biosynthesis O-methyltransferase